MPLPRRDHSSSLMKNGTLLLVYGGRNDNDESGKFGELSDLIVYDISLNQWSCIGTFGFLPSPRWNAALAVSEQREQIYLFGGCSYTQGSCSSQVFCLDYN